MSRKVFWAIALECLKVSGGALLILAVLFLLFGVEPGEGYSWPV